MRYIHTWITTIALGICLAVAGCDAVDTTDGTNEARLSVMMTDAPFPFELANEASVTISQISAETQGEGSVVLSDEAVTLNLLDLLGGVTEELVDVEVPAGIYSRILLDVTDASVTLDDGRTFDVNVPSDRIRILIGNVQLDPGESATVLLDFDVSQSFVVQGNPNTPAGINGFIFRPVVHPLGFVSDDEDDDGQGAEVQGMIDVSFAEYIEVGGTRYLITDETEIDGGTAASLTEGTIVEIEFTQRADGAFVAREIEIVDDQDRDVHETSGVVTDVEIVDGVTYIEVGALRFAVVPGETQFEGVADAGGLVVDETEVEVDYFSDANGVLIAVKVEVEDNDFDDDEVDDNDD